MDAKQSMRPKDTPLTPSCDLLMPPLWRSMRGLMGRPALRSASPCRKIYQRMGAAVASTKL